ncbi:MAG: GntR family transcriptional regulator [Trueperaceae bacterium]
MIDLPISAEAQSATPAFRKVAEQIAWQIERGEMPPGSRIPAERKLADQYGISRMTARAAVEHLAQRGIVERKDRSGTYVAQPKVRLSLSTTAGLTDQFKGVGIIPGASLIQARTARASAVPSEVGAALELGRQDRVHQVIRQRTGNGEPLVLEESYFPEQCFPGLLAHDLTTYSVYGLLQDQYGQRLQRFHQELELTQLGAARARALETRPDVMAFRVTRIAWNSSGIPVEFARDYYRGDRIVFTTAAAGRGE